MTVGGSENNSLMLLFASKKKHEIKAFLKKNFLKGTPKAEKAVKSTDGRLTIPNTQKTAGTGNLRAVKLRVMSCEL